MTLTKILVPIVAVMAVIIVLQVTGVFRKIDWASNPELALIANQ